MDTQIAQLYRLLFLYVKKRVNNQEDAEDITQEVFYKLSKSNTDEVDNIKNWVYAVAKNSITDYYRKKKVPTSELGFESILEESNEALASKQLSECITSFVNELPEEYRAVMILSELNEIPQKEIAAQLDMNYVTVRSKVQRGRKKLKALFSECCTVVQGGKGSILDYVQNNSCGHASSCSNFN